MAGKTLYDKHQVRILSKQRDDGSALIYIDNHIIHEVTSPQAKGCVWPGASLGASMRLAGGADDRREIQKIAVSRLFIAGEKQSTSVPPGPGSGRSRGRNEGRTSRWMKAHEEAMVSTARRFARPSPAWPCSNAGSSKKIAAEQATEHRRRRQGQRSALRLRAAPAGMCAGVARANHGQGQYRIQPGAGVPGDQQAGGSLPASRLAGADEPAPAMARMARGGRGSDGSAGYGVAAVRSWRRARGEVWPPLRHTSCCVIEQKSARVSSGPPISGAA